MSTLLGSSRAENPETSLRQEFSLFDRNPDPALDELTELAAILCSADYAYVGWVDYSRLWFKSRFGFRAVEQPRATSACQWMLDSGKPMIVADGAQDGRFPKEGISLAGVGYCRSYAGAPLTDSSQQIVGTIAVLSREANQFKPEHLTLLEVLGRQVITRLELYNRLRSQEQAVRAQQRTERALAVERCFVSATLDSIPALVTVLDTAGRIVRMNLSCAQTTGLSLADSIGRAFVDEVLEPADREWAEAKLRGAAHGQDSGPHETQWRTVGGETRRVSWTLRPLPGPSNEIQYIIVTGQDVTDKRRMEIALNSTEARYREVVENSLGFLFTCSMEGRITSLNAFTAETLGYPASALVGRMIFELMEPASAASFQESLRTLSAGGEWQGYLPLRRSDGAYRRIALRSRRTELPDEQPFVLNHGMDVTEQHEAEEALHLVTRQRELILQSVGDGIFGIDMEGRLSFINDAGAEMLGYMAEELAACDIQQLFNHSQPDGTKYTKATHPILQALRRSEPIRMRDEVFWRKDGSSLVVEYSANPILDDGAISGMVIAFQDVSERRRLENMKDEFISTVSHELRTPLSSLRASLGLVASGSLDKRPEKQRQMIDLAIGNTDRLIRLVNDILDFESMEKGHIRLQRKRLEAMDMLRRAADIAHKAASDARIGFRIEAPSSPVIFADEERVLQVLSELIANAIKFSPQETTIRMAAQTAGTSVTGVEEVCFTVEDQGRGIAPEKLERIFDRFQQGDASDSRAMGGTGLGLAICRSIVEQHGGRVWAESAVGRGSRFLFTLPAATGTETQ
jgi:two-component system, OmpR family, sensor histidine kinase VicK